MKVLAETRNRFHSRQLFRVLGERYSNANIRVDGLDDDDVASNFDQGGSVSTDLSMKEAEAVEQTKDEDLIQGAFSGDYLIN